MKFKYNHFKSEKKWRIKWFKNNIFKFNPNSKKPPFYVLDMFPYPSGKGLHVGHPRGYTASDIYARWKKMKGYEVLHPIGWDAFGLPTEQYAIKTKNSPQVFTKKNINNFRNQLQLLGFSYDYSIEINTSDPEYFRWTQWIFLEMYKRDLVVSELSPVNWCDKLGTVLADEETEILEGNVVSTIGKFPVKKKFLRQWNIRISKYADRLLSGLDKINWPNNVKSEQIHWIGRTDGFTIDVLINNSKYKLFLKKKEDIFNLSGILISPESTLISKKNINENKDFFSLMKNLNDVERKKRKDKIIFIEKHALINNIKIPIFISSGIFEDQKSIIFPLISKKNNIKSIKILKKDIKNIKFSKFILYKLRDWIFSRQRFWGEPFPFYYDNNNNVFIEKKLPLKLPKINFTNLDNNIDKTPLEKIDKWYSFKINNKTYFRDKNVMPQWAGSCWYYIGFLLKALSKNNKLDLLNKKNIDIINKFLPVNIYIGGKEHAITHLIYARFWHLFLYDLKIVRTSEPFLKLVNQGMILGENNQKMSKSVGNVVNPDEIIELYGADALRLYEMYLGPINSNQQWKEKDIVIMRKWIDRFYILCTTFIDTNDDHLDNEINETIYEVENNIKKFKFNIAISKIMVFINKCYLNNKKISKNNILNLLKITSTIIPFVCEDIWEKLNQKKYLYFQKWPKFIKINKIPKNCNIPVQINGKMRKIFNVSWNISQNIFFNIIKKDCIIQKYIKNKKIKKIIFVKNKIFNIVIYE